MISPCLWEDASIVLQLGFLAILFLCYIRNNLYYFCKGRKRLREVEKYPADGKYGLSYKLSIICSILMLSTQVVALVTSQQQDGSRCESKASLLSSRIMQVISWTITLIVLHKLRSKNRIAFPWMLRFWWTSSFLLSVARAMIDAHCIITQQDQLGVQEYDDIVNLAASICLLILSIRGKTGATFSTTENISEPLLNGKTEKNSEVKRDNPYGNATLIQLVTFSWLNPLFEFGYKKVLGQDEVPDVIPRTLQIFYPMNSMNASSA